MTETVSPPAPVAGRLSTLDRFLPVWIGVAMAAGLLLGRWVPGLNTTHEVVEASDVVITMGCGDACPVFPGISYRNWDLGDPAGKGVEAVRPIRDEIKTRAEALVAELLPAQPAS